MRNFIVDKNEVISEELKKDMLNLLSENDRACEWLNDSRCGIRLLPALNGEVILIFSDGGVHPCHYGPAFHVAGARYSIKSSYSLLLKYEYFSKREIKLEPLYTVSVLTYDGVTLDDSGFYSTSFEEAQKEASRLEKYDGDCYQAYVELW